MAAKPTDAPLSNQSVRTGRQTAPTAVTTIAHPHCTVPRWHRQDRPLAGSRAIRQDSGVQDQTRLCGNAASAPSLTLTISQGRCWNHDFEAQSDPDAPLGRRRDLRQHRHSDTLQRRRESEVGNRCQVLVTGSADQLDPAALIVKGGDWSGVSRPTPRRSVIDCHRRLLAPPISTMIFRRLAHGGRDHTGQQFRP